jgi:hypothetical protein
VDAEVTYANEPAEIGLQVTGCEDIHDGCRTRVDNLNKESGTAYKKNADMKADLCMVVN